MDYKISYERGPDFIRIVASGEIKAEDTAKMAIDGLAAGEKAGCIAFLIDYRECVVADSAVDTFEFMSGLEKLGIPRDAKIGLVVHQDFDKHDFAETVAVNRGWQVQYFKDIHAAEEWLCG